MIRPSSLFIDGDILCYRAAWKAQEDIAWADGEEAQKFVNVDAANQYLQDGVAEYSQGFGKVGIFICLSHPDNWRKELWPEYKANRRNLPKPVLLDHCKKYLALNFKSPCCPRLEADDIMGIAVTKDPNAVMVSIDKDMRTVPGWLYDPKHPEVGAVRIHHTDAFFNHMYQTLTGDPTDGYKGCPGIGDKKAKAILESLERTRNSKESIRNWRKELWRLVVKTYQEKGLAKQDALLNARLANILTFGKYDPKTFKIKLWQPPQ